MDARLGRYTSKDPIYQLTHPDYTENYKGALWYQYCNNNPVNLIDPSGLSVTNNTGNTIWINPEENLPGNEPIELKPGKTYDGPQDGFSDLVHNPIKVFKNSDGVNIIVNADGTVNLKGSYFGLIGTALFGGWKDESWIKKADAAWTKLAEKAGYIPVFNYE